MDESKKKAVWLQLFIEEHYGLDISSYQLSEIRSLTAKLAEFCSLDVETEDLEAAGDYSKADIALAGYRS